MRIFQPAVLIAIGLAGLAATARAETPPPQGLLNLSSSASVEVPRDVLAITFSTSREGVDAGAVQSQLKQALDAALAEARKVAQPGRLDIHTGNFALYPRYASKGDLNGWQGSAELVVEGRDMQAIGQLSARITTLTVARVAYSLSPEVREKAEAEASAQAIARYRAKAAEYAHQFGYAGFAIREVNVNSNEAGPPRPFAMQAKVAAASSAALPIEAGNGAVVINVSGTVMMK